MCGIGAQPYQLDSQVKITLSKTEQRRQGVYKSKVLHKSCIYMYYPE